MSDGLVYWSPWAEAAWNIPLDQLGPAPRDARSYQPPYVGSTKRIPYVVAAAIAAPGYWLLQRLLDNEPLGPPLVALMLVTATAGLILFGPKLFVQRETAEKLDLDYQLRLAKNGSAVKAEVVTVRYDRAKTRAGYRDGTAIDTRSGVAKLRFDAALEPDETPSGEMPSSREVELQFRVGEPSLKDGDEVTVLYMPDDPQAWLPVFRMNDIEMPMP